jgi:hypothetical protein
MGKRFRFRFHHKHFNFRFRFHFQKKVTASGSASASRYASSSAFFVKSGYAIHNMIFNIIIFRREVAPLY